MYLFTSKTRLRSILWIHFLKGSLRTLHRAHFLQMKRGSLRPKRTSSLFAELRPISATLRKCTLPYKSVGYTTKVWSRTRSIRSSVSVIRIRPPKLLESFTYWIFAHEITPNPYDQLAFRGSMSRTFTLKLALLNTQQRVHYTKKRPLSSTSATFLDPMTWWF